MTDHRKSMLFAGAAALAFAFGPALACAQDVEAGAEAETQVAPQVPGADTQESGEMGAATELDEQYQDEATVGAEADLDAEADAQVSPQVPSAEAETGEMGAGAEADPTE